MKRGKGLFVRLLIGWLAATAVLQAETIDILIVFDTTGRAWAQGNGGMQVVAEHAVNRINQAMQNSGIDCEFRLVLATNVAYTYNGSLEDALLALRNGAGEMDAVHGWREAYAADVVALLVDTGSAYGWVGLGYLLTSPAGQPENAFTANAIRSVAISHTLTHELGHNLGAHHSKFQSSDPGPNWYLNSYSAGWYFTGLNNTKYHTIMAYNSDGYGGFYQPAPLFSTPLVLYQGVPAGHAQDGDNARTIRETQAIVAGYRHTPNQAPWAPVLISPEDGAENVSITPLLVASAFFDPDGHEHANSRWQVAPNSQFLNPAWDSGSQGAASTQVQVPANRLKYKTRYYWRVRYRDSGGAWSPWSETRQFVTENALGRYIRIEGDLNFGTVNTGDNATRLMTIHNDGLSAMAVQTILYPIAFQGNWAGGIIPANGSQGVWVTFTPTLEGNYGGAIRVLGDWTEGNNMITCSGRGRLVQSRVLRIEGSLVFGAVPIAKTAVLPITLYNDGNSILTVTGIQFPPGFMGDWTSGPIWPNGSRTVKVTFLPMMLGLYDGTITIQSDKTAGPETIPCSGEGVQKSALASGLIQFAQETLWVEEGKTAIVHVRRVGGSEGTVSVRYKTVGRSAQPGEDYLHRAGVLTWQDGDALPRKVKVPILADGIAEPSEQFKVRLFDLNGAEFGDPSVATVWIAANTKGGTASAGWKSGVLAPDGSVWQERVFHGPGELAFDWRIASRSVHAEYLFFVNGDVRARLAGPTEWKSETFRLPEGTFTVRWLFLRDSLDPDGLGLLERVTWR